MTSKINESLVFLDEANALLAKSKTLLEELEKTYERKYFDSEVSNIVKIISLVELNMGSIRIVEKHYEALRKSENNVALIDNQLRYLEVDRRKLSDFCNKFGIKFDDQNGLDIDYLKLLKIDLNIADAQLTRFLKENKLDNIELRDLVKELKVESIDNKK